MNRTVSLVRYAAIEGKGWRRGAVVLQTKNGKLKHPYMVVGKQEVAAPNGRYQIRKYEGVNPVYIDLGNDPTDALNRFRSEESKKNAREQAVLAGLEVVNPEDASRKTLKKCAAEFIAMHQSLPHRSDDSVRVYTQITTTFLAQSKAKFADDVTQADVIGWYGWMKVKGYSDRTRSNLYQSLRGFLRYCGLDPNKVIDRGTHTLMLKYTKRTPNMYDAETVANLIQFANDGDEALVWDFAYKTGLRESELRMLTRDDLHGLNTPNPIVHVRERDEYGRIKDAEERIVELHASLIPTLKQWLKDNPAKRLLFGTDADKPNNKLLRTLKRTAKRAGLNCGRCAGCLSKAEECREFTLHRFRRTYTTRMLVATHGDLRSVMKQTGHSDMESVMRYIAPSSQIRNALITAF